MKKYSKEAKELLSTMELYEIKGGGDGPIKIEFCNTSCTICNDCTGCAVDCTACTSTCTVCTTRATTLD